jgi:hypothetical protein
MQESRVVEIESSLLLTGKGFGYAEHILRMSENVRCVCILSDLSSESGLPIENAGSLHGARGMCEFWIQTRITEWDLKRHTRDIQKIRQCVATLSLYDTQSPDSRREKVLNLIEEIAVRIFAFHIRCKAVHIRERVRLTTTGKYDPVATATAFKNQETLNGCEVLFGSIPFANGSILASLVQIHRNANYLDRWLSVHEEFERTKAAHRTAMPSSRTLLIEAHRSVRRIVVSLAKA